MGKHAAAWTTFWNIEAIQPIADPPADFAPPAINLVDVQAEPGDSGEQSRYFRENFPRDVTVKPANLYRAQRKRRLGDDTPARATP